MAKAPWEICRFDLWSSARHEPISTTAMVLAIGGSVLSGLGQIQAGKAANVNAKFQAGQLEQQAGQERASSQRVAIEERRRAAIAGSNATAAAASSGGGATDPTVLNITGAIAKQGEYNALSALFEGEERARSQELQATSTRMQGKQAKKAGYISGASTIIGGAGNALMAKYGPTGGTTIGTANAGGTRAPWQQPGMRVPSYAGGGTYG